MIYIYKYIYILYTERSNWQYTIETYQRRNIWIDWIDHKMRIVIKSNKDMLEILRISWCAFLSHIKSPHLSDVLESAWTPNDPQKTFTWCRIIICLVCVQARGHLVYCMIYLIYLRYWRFSEDSVWGNFSMDSNCSAWIALDQWLPTLRKRQIAARFTSSVGSNDIVGVEIWSPPRVVAVGWCSHRRLW